jgi:hypothetical protein
LPVESYLNTGNRGMFEGQGETMMLHPDFRAPADAEFCAPMVRGGPRLAAAQAALRARAEGVAPAVDRMKAAAD